MKVVDANKRSTFTICEAVDCYQTATKAIVITVGKFGTITLNLCYKCSVTKFGK